MLFIGLMKQVSSSTIGSPRFGMCCNHGKLKSPSLRVPPQPLYDLFTTDTLEAKDFQTCMVQYNSALAFTSLGVKVGPPVFRIHGELRHLSGSLLPFFLFIKCIATSWTYSKICTHLSPFVSTTYDMEIPEDCSVRLFCLSLITILISSFSSHIGKWVSLIHLILEDINITKTSHFRHLYFQVLYRIIVI